MTKYTTPPSYEWVCDDTGEIQSYQTFARNLESIALTGADCWDMPTEIIGATREGTVTMYVGTPNPHAPVYDPAKGRHLIVWERVEIDPAHDWDMTGKDY